MDLTERIGFWTVILFGSMAGYEIAGWWLAILLGVFAGFMTGFVGGHVIGFGVAALYCALRMCC